jgi:membrane-bound lytic murein transglycosylase D
VGATLNESIVVHHKNNVGAPDRCQVVRYDDGSLPLHQTVQCFEHGFISRSLERGRPVVPMMCDELEKRYLPSLLHYLSMIESGYIATAASQAKAVGPWQFIPETGQRYGLRINAGGFDERSDYEKSTRAAAAYLNDLLFDFGGDDLLLALASYNRGEQGVRNALRKLENPFSERSYWRLVETGKLPKERPQ